MYIIFTKVVDANVRIAPTIYGTIADLYSAFSPGLITIYFIPTIASTSTDTTTPIICIAPTIPPAAAVNFVLPGSALYSFRLAIITVALLLLYNVNNKITSANIIIILKIFNNFFLISSPG